MLLFYYNGYIKPLPVDQTIYTNITARDDTNELIIFQQNPDYLPAVTYEMPEETDSSNVNFEEHYTIDTGTYNTHTRTHTNTHAHGNGAVCWEDKITFIITSYLMQYDGKW